MTKADFIAKYKNLITVFFNFEELASAPTITLRDCTKSVTEFLDFYVPRYAKNGLWDNRHITQIIQDDDSVIVQLKDIIASPAAWGVEPFHNANELSEQLWPVPIATDSEAGKTLVLDSNHTICTLLIAGIKMDVPCVELVGDELSKLGPDLLLMQH